jgi:serine/threonine protein kinase
MNSAPCPPPELLAKLRANALSEEEARPLRAHLAECAACRDQVAPTKPAANPAAHREYLRPPEGPDELGRLGGYILRRVLGEGGMGIVFEAEDAALHRPVAVKVLKPSLCNESFRKRFVQEARIAAALPHDHIITIYQAGEDNGVPFLAMERLHGESLEDRLRRDRWLPLAEALDVARQVADGLAVAHRRHLVHRDIKPDNVWLATDGPGGPFLRVKLLDFGLARSIQGDANLTTQGMILGTPNYMAPERLRGLPVNERADLFSLGCVLYRSLAGVAPFDGDARNTGQVVAAVLQQEPTPLAEKAPGVPPGVVQLVDELLAKNPADRPASAKAVAKRLRNLEFGHSPAAVGASQVIRLGTTQRMVAWTQRQGWGLWAGAATILAALVVVAVVGFAKLTGGPPPPNRTEEPRR